MRIAVGTFTDGFMGGAPGEGIHFFEIDAQGTGARQTGVVTGLHSPSYLARHPRLPLLYAAERAWSAQDKAEGALATIALAGESAPQVIDRRRSGGGFSAHVSVSPDGRFAALANPLGPNIAVFPLGEDGLPGQPTCFAFTGQGPRPRQSAPWPHSCWFDPRGRHLFACDLGLDRISIYDLDPDRPEVTSAAFACAHVSSGAGARHMAIRPDGRFCHVANELDGTISTFTIDPARGTLTIVQTIACAAAPCQPCEIVCDAAGRFAYVTLRGTETVGVYACDEDSGRLTPLPAASCLGDTPRHFALSPDGRMALVCNQLSGDIRSFAVGRDGGLTPTGLVIPVPSPSCLVFL